MNKQHPVISARNLPTPRIELRWRNATKAEQAEHEYPLICDYDLIIGLRETDKRAEDDEGNIGKGKRYLRVNIGQTCSTGTLESKVGASYIDSPFRDGAHAQWDGAQLGRPPIYAVAKGKAQLRDYAE